MHPSTPCSASIECGGNRSTWFATPELRRRLKSFVSVPLSTVVIMPTSQRNPLTLAMKGYRLLPTRSSPPNRAYQQLVHLTSGLLASPSQTCDIDSHEYTPSACRSRPAFTASSKTTSPDYSTQACPRPVLLNLPPGLASNTIALHI